MSPRRDSADNILTGLITACHPGPTAVVTLVITTMSLAAGRSMGGAALMGIAALTGQLSVGWSNDAHDAVGDLRVQRLDKPTVRGSITSNQLWVCALVALSACVPLSFMAAGLIGGVAHLIAVASAWAYNFYFKSTRASWLPYALSFGLIPTFVTYGLTPPHAPEAWLTVAAALMGVGAHLANALPDLQSDEAIGTGGVAVALGRRITSISAVCLLMAAIIVLLTHIAVGAVVSTTIIVMSGLVVIAALRSRNDKLLFMVTMGLALMAVGLLLLSSASLSTG